MTKMEATKSNSNSGKLSFWAIVVIAANTMNGPGLTALPAIAQSAGHITYAVLVLAVMCVTLYVIKRLCMLYGVKNCYSPELEESDIVALSGKAWI
jgi:amino acid transporter